MMLKFNLRDFLLLSISATLLLGLLNASSGSARNSHSPDQNTSLRDQEQITPSLGNLSRNTITPTPDATNVINLPIVQQDVSLQTSEPQASGEITPLPSITPTPIPPQTIEDNAPIVFGAIAIVLIIILAWVFLGRKTFDKGN